MEKIKILLSGGQASGKTTFAENLLAKNPQLIGVPLSEKHILTRGHMVAKIFNVLGGQDLVVVDDCANTRSVLQCALSEKWDNFIIVTNTGPVLLPYGVEPVAVEEYEVIEGKTIKIYKF